MLLIKGIIIGIGKIIPGVSGSILAICMGIYEDLIYSINNLFKDFKNNFKILFDVGIGIIISVIFFSKIILFFLDKYYFITMFLFIGLIIGGLEKIDKKIDKKDRYISLIIIIVLLLLSLLSINNNVEFDSKIINFIYYIIVGFIDAFTMIVPGISGTAILMMIGCYGKVLESFSSILNINLLYNNLIILIPFFIGVLMGIILTSKLINYLFNNYKSKTYSAILGFSISSIIIMALKSFSCKYNIYDLIIGMFLLISGIIITKKINHMFND